LSISFPIDGDPVTQDIFVKFLGGPHFFTDCCRDSNLIDGIDALGLSASERLAMWVYTSARNGWYSTLNSDLRAGAPARATTDFARILLGALHKLPQYDGEVYRSFQSRDFETDLGAYLRHPTKTWYGFSSTTLDEVYCVEAYPGNLFFTIHSKTGRRLCGNSPIPFEYSAKPFEQEVLFAHPSKFRVVSVERRDDKASIELEEIVDD
jgi:NAD:arginine ADP-ribosyltransferase